MAFHLFFRLFRKLFKPSRSDAKGRRRLSPPPPPNQLDFLNVLRFLALFFLVLDAAAGFG